MANVSKPEYRISKETVAKFYQAHEIRILGYESPISMITEQLAMNIAKQTDDGVCEAVAKIGIVVDKDELVKALQYDRGQYDKGYVKGFNDAVAKLPLWARILLRRRVKSSIKEDNRD